MSSPSKNEPLGGLRVGISGGIPPREERVAMGCNELDLNFTVQRLADRVLSEGGSLVYGSHPTFTPIIESVATGRLGYDQPHRVRMHVAPHFFFVPESTISWEDYTGRHSRYAQVVPAGEPSTERQPALDILRGALIRDADAMVCIGGLSHQNDPRIRPGVDQEVELAIQAGKPVFLIGWAGGRTRDVYEDWRRRDPEALMRNRLSLAENDILGRGDFGKPYSVAEAVLLVLTGLRRLAGS